MTKMLSKGTMMAMAFALSMAVATPFAVAQSTGSTEGEQGDRAKKEWRGGGKHGRHGKRGMHGGRMFAGLDLTDAQKAQIGQIRETNRESLRPIMDQVRAKRQQLRELRAAGNADEAAVKQLREEMTQLHSQLAAERTRIHQEILTVLTPEQRTELEQKREQFKNRRNERRERRDARNAV